MIRIEIHGRNYYMEYDYGNKVDLQVQQCESELSDKSVVTVELEVNEFMLREIFIFRVRQTTNVSES
jgi:hypothetical protein